MNEERKTFQPIKFCLKKNNQKTREKTSLKEREDKETTT
jgi:hypothetical protein